MIPKIELILHSGDKKIYDTDDGHNGPDIYCPTYKDMSYESSFNS